MEDSFSVRDIPTLTVFTPSYNHGRFLIRVYKSLKRQTNKDFCWIIVDDGSTDGTQEIVKDFLREPEFYINYFLKENGGLHTAYNTAIEKINTPLAACCDADDVLVEDAVDKIVNFWLKNGSEKYAGIYGLCYDTEGKSIGGPFSEGLHKVNTKDIEIGRIKMKRGDMMLVVRSELYKQVAPMLGFEGEKYFNPHYMHHLICKKYDFLVLNECLMIKEYQVDGLSNNMLWQYYNSPRSFREIRRLYLGFKEASLKYKVKNAIHYSSSCILAHDIGGVLKSPCPFLIMVLFPLGLLFSIYIRVKIKFGHKSSIWTRKKLNKTR